MLRVHFERIDIKNVSARVPTSTFLRIITALEDRSPLYILNIGGAGYKRARDYVVAVLGLVDVSSARYSPEARAAYVWLVDPPLCSSAFVFGLFFSLLFGFGGFLSLVFGVVWCCSATVLLLFCLNGVVRVMFGVRFLERHIVRTIADLKSINCLLNIKSHDFR